MNPRITLLAVGLAAVAGALLLARADRVSEIPEGPADAAPAAAPVTEPVEEVDGLAVGPSDRAPEIVVLDAIEPEPARAAPRSRRSTPPAAAEPAPVVLASAGIPVATEAPSGFARPASSKGSVRIDPRLDTAGGGARLGERPRRGDRVPAVVGVYVGGDAHCEIQRYPTRIAGF